MKTMSCHELGGPATCEHTFTAESFEEIAEQSKNHGMAMIKAQDGAHLEAADKMKALMADSSKMQRWFTEKQQLFMQKEHE